LKVFVFSFGTIEILDGILVVDTDLTYKTFEKEYHEILKSVNKNIKKLLKEAFEGEVLIKNSKIESQLLSLLEKLKAYDQPNFTFSETFEESIENKPASASPLATNLNIDDLEEPDVFEEPISLDSETSISLSPDSVEKTISTPQNKQAEMNLELKAGELQDSLSAINSEDELEEPEPINLDIEEIPISEMELEAERVTSQFLVQIIEEAEFKTTSDLQIKSAKVKGQIQLQNSGKHDRIWDINIRLDEKQLKSTSLKKSLFHKNELNPGEIWSQKYEVLNPKKIPVIVKERIDTYSESSKEIHTLIPNKVTLVKFRYYIENPNSHDLSNLILKKQFPVAFTNLKILEEAPKETHLQFEPQALTWTIPLLKSKQSVTLKIQAKIIPTKSIKAGPLQITGDMIGGLYSNLIIEDISSISKNMYYIEKDENETQPDHWICRFIFENKSEFPFLLENAEIYSGAIDSDRKEVVFKAINEIIQPSDPEWRSHEWTIASKDIPTFGKIVQFKIIPLTKKVLHINLSIDEILLPILWADVKKTYSVTELASYVDTPLTVNIHITNQGEADINEIFITDFIPENFIPPALEDLHLFLNGKALDLTKKKLEISFEREPDTTESKVPHQLHFHLLNLQSSIGGLKKGSKLEVQYLIKAVKPPPNKIYQFPIKLTLTSLPDGAPLEIIPAMVENSEIKVTHKRRKVTIGKSVSPGAAPDEYEIEILLKNRGNTAIEHAIISDLIPSNFTLLNSSPEASTKDLEGKTLLEWNLPLIPPGKELTITYVIKGTGNYTASDAEIFYKV